MACAVAAGLSAGAEHLSAWFNARRLKRLPRFGVDLYAAFCAAPLLAGYLGLTLYYWEVNRNYDYFAYVKELQSFTRPQSVNFSTLKRAMTALASSAATTK